MKKTLLVCCLAMLLTMLCMGTAMATTEADLIAAASIANSTITLDSNVALSKKLVISADNVTIIGNGYTIYDEGFGFDPVNTHIESWQKAEYNLVDISGSNVTLKNVILKSNDTRNTLNLYGSKNTVLDNVTLNHSANVNGGAALVVNGSTVSVKNGLSLLAGPYSWGGINVGQGSNVTQTPVLTFTQGSTLAFTSSSPYDLPALYKDAATVDLSTSVKSYSENVVFDTANMAQGILGLHIHNYVNNVCACGSVLPVAYSAPKTGDNSQLMLWALLMAASAGAMMLMLRRKQQAR